MVDEHLVNWNVLAITTGLDQDTTGSSSSEGGAALSRPGARLGLLGRQPELHALR